MLFWDVGVEGLFFWRKTGLFTLVVGWWVV
jgi:hypothetical protein